MKVYMAKLRNRLKYMMIILSCVLLTASCSKKEPYKTEITLIHGWGAMDNDHVSMRRIYESFQEENPNIKINLVSMPSSEEVIKKANDMISVGKIPDIIFTGGVGTDSYYRFSVDNGYALDLMPYIKNDTLFDSNLAPELKDYWITDSNHLYCISDVLLLSGGYWYNKEIFKKVGAEAPPKTWEDFFDVLEKIKLWSLENSRSIVPIQLNANNCIYIAHYLLLNENGVGAESILNKEVLIENMEFINVLERMKDIYKYSVDTSSFYGYRDELSMFNSGNSAIYINGVWAGQMISDNLDAEYALLPSVNTNDTSCISACLGYIVGNTGNKEKMEASIKFLKYMVSEKVQKTILLETGQVPSNPKINLNDYAEEKPRLSQAVRIVKEANFKVEVPEKIWSDGRSDVFKKNIMEVLKGNMNDMQFIDLLR